MGIKWSTHTFTVAPGAAVRNTRTGKTGSMISFNLAERFVLVQPDEPAGSEPVVWGLADVVITLPAGSLPPDVARTLGGA